MNRWTKMHETEIDGFSVYVWITWDDTNPRECFDCFDNEEQEREFFRKIETGFYEWFGFQVRAFKHGIELGSASLWNCCYENPRDILTDGTFLDVAHEAIEQAKQTINTIIEGEKIGLLAQEQSI